MGASWATGPDIFRVKTIEAMISAPHERIRERSLGVTAVDGSFRVTLPVSGPMTVHAARADRALPSLEPRPERFAVPDSREAAFATHVIPEIEVLARVALSLTRNQADAEDLVQDALVRAYRAIDRFDGRHPRAWLLTILRNTNLNRVAKRAVVVTRSETAREAVERTPSRDAGPEDQTMDRTFDAVVGRELAALPEQMRAVIEMVDMDGLSYQEAAEALGVPVGTVMSRLHRARKRMRDKLVAAGLTAHGRRS